MATPPSVDNLTIGRGKVYIAEFTGATHGEYVEVGNCPSFEFEPRTEKLAHYTSRSGLRQKDQEIVVQTEYQITFETDELAAENLQRFTGGAVSGSEIRVLKAPNKFYALKFVTDNPVGPNYTYEFHKCTIASNGSLQLISEEWAKASFTAVGLSDPVNHPDSELATIQFTTTTTTTLV